MNSSYQGIILSGGTSSRMGTDKALLKYKSTDFIQMEINVLSQHVEEVMIIGDVDKYQSYNVPVFSDIITGKGPLGGILTGLAHSKLDHNIVLSCDVPKVESNFIKAMMKAYNGEDALVCSYEGKIHPLVGIYHRKALSELNKAILFDTLKVQDALDQLQCKYFKVPDHLAHQLQNINTPKDYADLENE